MRFLFEEGEEVKEQYKTAISDARWIAYDIPGNVGWIAYLVCVFRGLREKKDSYNIASALPGVLMLIGVGKLISERIAGLDRVLSGKRLFRGFGALTAGGLLGNNKVNIKDHYRRWRRCSLPVFHFAISSNVSPVIRYVVHSSMGTAPRDR